MSEPIIRVEGLGKKYRLHHQSKERYTTLRDTLVGATKRLFRRPVAGSLAPSSDEEFWALKDLNFEVQPGEVVGIIGRNGAGKSTLLKILSRITEPTKGRVTLNGRVASLLEVGTGFHPELTGRENIFLNGAILGMSKVEIKAKFDEIVDFAEVERFLDTPVKRYSSGMYVRLAFAVAAHLEPEILVVDEVLAVGDAKFQRKSLARMHDSAASGRTILFVSHSMSAVSALCSRAVLLQSGKVAFDGQVNEAIAKYGEDDQTAPMERAWDESTYPGDSTIRLTKIRISQPNSNGTIRSSQETQIIYEFICSEIEEGLCIGFELISPEGSALFWTHFTDSKTADWPQITLGTNQLACTIPAGLLNSGTYGIAPKLSIHNSRWIANLPVSLTFHVEMDHGVSPLWTSLATGKRPGLITPILPWHGMSPFET
jgi:lipopolysaccharide transport system ATP-binding protein